MEETRLDKHGLELVWSKIKEAVRNLRTKVGTAELTTTAKDLSGAVNELKNANDGKQDKTDNSLTTITKTVAGAVNELKNDLTPQPSANLTKQNISSGDLYVQQIGNMYMVTLDAIISTAATSWLMVGYIPSKTINATTIGIALDRTNNTAGALQCFQNGANIGIRIEGSGFSAGHRISATQLLFIK